MIDMSVESLAENVREFSDHMAMEIARRVAADLAENYDEPPEWWIESTQPFVHKHAQAVLLDWFLGDFIPGAKR